MCYSIMYKYCFVFHVTNELILVAHDFFAHICASHQLTVFQNLDVDQIIMEHYQSAGTTQPSISKLMPFTPTVIKDNDARPESSCLPPELCLNCSHGLKVYI